MQNDSYSKHATKYPETPEGKSRSQTASHKQFLCAVRGCRLPSDPTKDYAERQVRILANWPHEKYFHKHLVQELA